MRNEKLTHFSYFLSYHFIHDDIMRFRRYLCHTLKRKANTYFIYIRMSAEESVVIAFASTQPMTSSIKSHTWHQCEAYLVISLECIPYWFHNMKGPLFKVGTRSIATQFHRFITRHLGQDNCHSLQPTGLSKDEYPPRLAKASKRGWF